MHSYAGISLYSTSISIVDDGDAKTAASVGVALEGLRNDTTALINFILGAYPGGTLMNGTLKGNSTIRNNGGDNNCNFIGVDVVFDDVCTSVSRCSWNVTQGSWTFGGAGGQTVSYACPVFISQPVSMTGTGRVRQRKQRSTGSGNRTIDVSATDVYIMESGEVTPGDKGVLVDGTADPSNTSWDTIRIVSFDSNAFPLYEDDALTAIEDANGSPIVLRRNPSAPGEYASVLLMWSGAFWEWIG